MSKSASSEQAVTGLHLDRPALFNQSLVAVQQEITHVLNQVDEAQVVELLNTLQASRTIVGVGAGRVGMALKGFIMRLGHMGLRAWMIGDTTVPAVADGDCLLVASGSGETKTIVDLTSIAKKNGAAIAAVTGNADSSIGKMADTIVIIPAPSKTKAIAGFQSQQPMTTLNEQCLQLFFDTTTLLLMARLNETHDTMWDRHSNLE